MTPTVHPEHQITCLCGTINQGVTSLQTAPDLSLCHCAPCRRSSGVLFTSYVPIVSPTLSNKLRPWRSDLTTNYFCSVCGCHVFRKSETLPDPAKELDQKISDGDWEVATGTILSTATPRFQDDGSFQHYSVDETKDGGASVWIEGSGATDVTENLIHTRAQSSTLPVLPTAPSGSLPASCACGDVQFHITRPHAESYKTHSPYPDFMRPDKTCPESLKANPDKEKWWIQEDGRKYMAGACACRSCRLSTGFEIQQWAFVPRTNILFHTKENGVGLLNFETLPRRTLTTYTSSPGVFREFCGGCGATVFWHDTIRPGVIDVSVGLLMAEEGARAESWLSWWTERLSFEEDTEVGRDGYLAATGRGLVTAFENGLKTWKRKASENKQDD